MFSSRTNWLLEQNELAKACARRKRAGLPILDLTESNPTECGFNYPESVLVAFQNREMLTYRPDPQGLLSARQAVANYYADQGIAIGPDQVFLTASTSEAYSFIFRLICDPGDQVLAPEPSYPLFDDLARLNDLNLARYPLQYEEGWKIDCESMASRVSARTRAILALHPNNPTGSFVAPREREFLLQLCNKRRLALLVDEVFLDYCYEAGSANDARAGVRPARKSPASSPINRGHDSLSSRRPRQARLRAGALRWAQARREARDQLQTARGITGPAPQSFAGERGALVFTLNGISKTAALPQMKCSWIVVSGPDAPLRSACARLEMIADTYLPVSTPVALALPELLASRRVLQRQIMSRLAGNLSALRRRLRAGSPVSRLSVKGGWYAILRVPRIRSDENWAIRLLEEEGVLVHPGHFYDFRREGYLVVSLLPPADIFVTGIRKLVRRIELDCPEGG
jgi:alanine-synthesizing transaminase